MRRALRPCWTTLALSVLLAIGFILPAKQARAEPILVFAAASLKDALDDVAALWKDSSGTDVTISYASSAVLARQIELGAPVDLFFSANSLWMDYLADRDRVTTQDRRDILSNTLVLIGPTGAEPGAIETLLTQGRETGRLAVGLTSSVPAGIYAKAALEQLGLWEGLAPHLAQTDNVRAALALVSVGAAPLGIVYASDALADPNVTTLATFPKDSHPRILYTAAPTPEADAKTIDFLTFLSGDLAKAVFLRHGFADITAAE